MTPHTEKPDLPYPGPDQPSEEEIQTLLRGFHPTPSARFFARMGNSPWAARGRPTTVRPRLVLVFASLLAALVIALAALAVPSVRATAQRLAQYFLRSTSDQASISVTPDQARGLEENFPLTLAEAAAAAGFPVQKPGRMPPFLHLDGAVYIPERRAVILSYRTESSNHILRLTQQWVGELESVASIGASAEVETVRIGELDGEYVSGGWRHPGLATPLANAAPGIKITLEADWDSTTGIQVLRWQQGDMLYELLSINATTPEETNLNKAELIAIAASME